MRKSVLIFVSFFSFLIQSNAQLCDELPLQEEVMLTENIALVHTYFATSDSIYIQTIKKWKGDSIPNLFALKKEPLLSKFFVLDTNKTYLLFYYHGLEIDRCSRTSEYKYVHFEYELDRIFQGGNVVNVALYDSINYIKKNIFKAEDQKTYDASQSKFAFYDYEKKEIVPFSALPKATSRFSPVRFYIIDENIESNGETFEKVFCVYRSSEKLKINNRIKKQVLGALYTFPAPSK